MNLAAPFIRRPVMTTLVMITLLLFGGISYRELPVSDLPNVDFPTITVSANLPGASPETMASAVATVLERQFSTIAGIDSMSSSSFQGQTQITLQFALNRDIDNAAMDVQAAIARAARLLPADMPAPPTYQKVNPADQPILYVALTSPTLPLSVLDEYGQTMLAQRISMINGVAQVQVYGSQKYAVRLQVDPLKLAAFGLGLDELAEAIRAGNVNLPTGMLNGPNRTYTVEADGQLLQARDYAPLIVAYRQGAPVRLQDIGRAVDSVENDKVAAWYCTAAAADRAIMLAIQRQPGMNTVAVADAVKKILPSFSEQLPESVSLRILFDRSIPIRDSSQDAQYTLLLTLGLVILVIFLFLRSWRATLIPSLALPMSMIGTFCVMYLLDYSLDNLSLMALTLAMGFVVDDAIVVLENIVRHMERGSERMTAAFEGSHEIGFTVVSMTISLAAVFIPVLFMSGLVGRLFREFAVTIGVAVLVSGFISLSLTPMLCSRFLRKNMHTHAAASGGPATSNPGWLLAGYDRSLKWALRHRGWIMLFSALILAATFWLGKAVPKGFLPTEDQGMIMIQTEAVEGTSFAAMVAHQQALVRVLQQDENLEAFMSSVGARGSGGNTGRLFVRLKPRAQRKLTADQIVQLYRRTLSNLPGLRTFVTNPSSLQIGGRMSKSQYQYTMQGADTDRLQEAAGRLMNLMREMPGLLDVTSDLQMKNPQLDIQLHRDLAASLGFSAQQIESALLNAYGSRQVSTIFAPNDQFQVILELLPQYQRDPNALALLHVRSAAGKLVPLQALATVSESVGPLSINHSGQMPSITLAFNLKPGHSVGEAVKKIDAAAKSIIPSGFTAGFQGTAQAFQSSMRGMGLLLLLAIAVIYIVLGILYESFIHPVTILTALPFAGVGALLALWLFGEELSLYAFVGIIMLVGLVKKNGIMMVDFAIEAQRQQGLGPVEAIHQACLIRFRPIMMTTMAALMGALPIALGLGAGGESRRPLGLAVVGGLLFSQTLTLYVTPVFYTFMDKLRRDQAKKRPLGAPAMLFLLLGFLVCRPMAAWAGEPVAPPLEVTVAQAILMGLENNQALRVEKSGPEIQKTYETQALGEFDPQLSGAVSQQQADAQQQTRTEPGTTNVDTTTLAVELAVSKKFSPGTRIELRGAANQLDNSLYSDDFGSARAGVSITQALLNGAGPAVNLATLRQARLASLASVFELRGFAEALVAQIEAAYWDYALAQRMITILMDSLKLAEDQLVETRERIRVGKMSQVELYAAESEVAARKVGLIAARANAEKSRLQLLRLLNPPGSNLWVRTIELTQAPVVESNRLDEVENHVAVALELRPDLNQARLSIQRNELEVVKTRNGLLPKLELFANLGASGYANSFGGAMQEVGSEYPDAMVGARLSYPLGNHEADARNRRAGFMLDQSREALSNLEQLAEVDVRLAYVEVLRAREEITATFAAERLRRETLKAETEKFRVGKSTTLLVAQAQRDLLLSSLEASRSVAGYLKALVALYRSEGSLLHRRGIATAEFQPADDGPYKKGDDDESAQ